MDVVQADMPVVGVAEDAEDRGRGKQIRRRKVSQLGSNVTVPYFFSDG